MDTNEKYLRMVVSQKKNRLLVQNGSFSDQKQVHQNFVRHPVAHQKQRNGVGSFRDRKTKRIRFKKALMHSHQLDASKQCSAKQQAVFAKKQGSALGFSVSKQRRPTSAQKAISKLNLLAKRPQKRQEKLTFGR